MAELTPAGKLGMAAGLCDRAGFTDLADAIRAVFEENIELRRRARQETAEPVRVLTSGMHGQVVGAEWRVPLTEPSDRGFFDNYAPSTVERIQIYDSADPNRGVIYDSADKAPPYEVTVRRGDTVVFVGSPLPFKTSWLFINQAEGEPAWLYCRIPDLSAGQ